MARRNNLHGTHVLGRRAHVICCCGYRMVSQSWEDYQAGKPPLCELPDCDDPAKELTREATVRRCGHGTGIQHSR